MNIIESTKESRQRIADAAKIAAEYLVDTLKPHKDNVHSDHLIELVNFVEEGAPVIVLRALDHLNAFMMFETLNDRGLKASQDD